LNIADALALSKTRCIALLATEGTLKSEALDDYIKPYITVASIVKIDASPLIDLVESGKFLEDDSSVKEAITKNTALLKSNQKVDVMILGSTHLALLKKQLADLYPSIQLIDPAMKTLERVKTYLQNHSMTALENAGLKILVSKNREQFEKIARKFGLQEPVEEVTLDFKVDAF
jgi:glutamate racemase